MDVKYAEEQEDQVSLQHHSPHTDGAGRARIRTTTISFKIGLLQLFPNYPANINTHEEGLCNKTSLACMTTLQAYQYIT